MSLSHFRNRFDVVHHPQLEREVKRAIFASWAADANAVSGKPATRSPAQARVSVRMDKAMQPRRASDQGEG